MNSALDNFSSPENLEATIKKFSSPESLAKIKKLLGDEGLAKFTEVLNGLNRKHHRANILIIGKTGSGKSTLVNAVFDKKLCKTGTGKPITQHIEPYTTPESPVAIWDTKGLELETYENIKNEIIKFVQEQNNSTDPDKYIHLVWLCIPDSGARVEDAEIGLVQNLKNDPDLQEFAIQVIVVITKCNNPRSETSQEFFKFVENTFKGCHVVQTRAVEEEIYNENDEPTGKRKPMWGIADLVRISYDLFPEAQRRAFARALAIHNKESLACKKEEAEKIITWAAGAAGAVALTPIPFSDAALLVPIQVAMIVKISSLFGLSIMQGDIGPAIASIAAPLAASLAGRSFVSGLLKLIPGVGTVMGGTIALTTASALTKALGDLYLKVLLRFIEKGQPIDDIGKVFEAVKKELEQN